jgi:uncharacterized protein YecE (DUF72 family)
MMSSFRRSACFTDEAILFRRIFDEIHQAKMHISIGTFGWHYNHWRGSFYPGTIPKSGWLEFYSKVFTTVEVNATFYRQLGQGTFQKWKDLTPLEFIWAVKANRFITHIKRLKNVEESLEKFFSQIGTLDNKLGPVLFQPPLPLRSRGVRQKPSFRSCPMETYTRFREQLTRRD